jgi:hypothetical protein
MLPSNNGALILHKIMRDRGFILHICSPKTVFLNGDIRSSLDIRSKETAAEQVDGLAEFLRACEAATATNGFAMSDETSISFEDFEARWAVDGLYCVILSNVAVVVAGCVEC